LILCLAVFAQADDQKGSKPPAEAHNKKAASKAKASRHAEQSLTGCLDERDGEYVLLDDQSMNTMADLQATTGGAEAVFAKHLGHKVIVRGEESSNSGSTVFKVRRIEDVSGVCAPAQGAK